jgi:hypothetical protein
VWTDDLHRVDQSYIVCTDVTLETYTWFQNRPRAHRGMALSADLDCESSEVSTLQLSLHAEGQ